MPAWRLISVCQTMNGQLQSVRMMREMTGENCFKIIAQMIAQMIVLEYQVVPQLKIVLVYVKEMLLKIVQTIVVLTV